MFYVLNCINYNKLCKFVLILVTIIELIMATKRTTEKLDFDKVWLMFQETDKKFQETDKKFQETDKKLRKLEDLFTSQWGKLMEKLVEGDLIKLLNERGIKVNYTHSRTKGIYNGKKFEFDIIAENGEEIVVVEVKTTLRSSDVKEFINKLKIFKEILPKYVNNKVIGGMAFLDSASNSELMAENKGLLVIKATGSSASITNSPDFVPKVW